MDKDLKYFPFSLPEIREIGIITGLSSSSGTRPIPTELEDLHRQLKETAETEWEFKIEEAEATVKTNEGELDLLKKDQETATKRVDELIAQGINTFYTHFLLWAGGIASAGAVLLISRLLKNVLDSSELTKLIGKLLYALVEFIANIPTLLYKVLFGISILLILAKLGERVILSFVKKKEDMEAWLGFFYRVSILFLIVIALGILGGGGQDSKNTDQAKETLIKTTNTVGATEELLEISHEIVATGITAALTVILMLLFYLYYRRETPQLFLSKKAIYFFGGLWVLGILSLLSILLSNSPLTSKATYSITLIAVFLVISSFFFTYGLTSMWFFSDKSAKDEKVEEQQRLIKEFQNHLNSLEIKKESLLLEIEKEYCLLRTEFFKGFDQASFIVKEIPAIIQPETREKHV